MLLATIWMFILLMVIIIWLWVRNCKTKDSSRWSHPMWIKSIIGDIWHLYWRWTFSWLLTVQLTLWLMSKSEITKTTNNDRDCPLPKGANYAAIDHVCAFSNVYNFHLHRQWVCERITDISTEMENFFLYFLCPQFFSFSSAFSWAEKIFSQLVSLSFVGFHAVHVCLLRDFLKSLSETYDFKRR